VAGGPVDRGDRGGDHGGGGPHVGGSDRVDQGLGVLDGQRAGGARGATGSAALPGHGEHVGAEAGDALLDRGRRPAADRDQQDHRSHADRDAQRGQRGPQLVGGQAPNGDAENLDDDVTLLVVSRAS
jgi:hypothetical protein